MSKIKVGDKIRIKKDDNVHHFSKGTICEVVEIYPLDNCVDAVGEATDGTPNLCQLLYEEDYELIIDDSRYIACANRIIEDLKDRKGFDEAFDLDDDILGEIVEEIAANIKNMLGDTND